LEIGHISCGGPFRNAVTNGVEAHAVFTHIEHAVARGVEGEVVGWAKVLGNPASLWWEGVEFSYDGFIGAGLEEGGSFVELYEALGEVVGVGFPVVGCDGEAELLGESRDDGAAGKGVEECGISWVKAGGGDGLADEWKELALVADVGDKLREDVVFGVPRGVVGGGVTHGWGDGSRPT